MPKKKSGNLRKLNALKFGLAGGIVAAICVFVTTVFVILKPDYGMQYTGFLKDIYGFLGYDATLLGAVLGAIYGFIDCFIFTWVFALVYNKLIG